MSQGNGWWLASDGKWYPPDQLPGAQTSGQPATAWHTPGDEPATASTQPGLPASPPAAWLPELPPTPPPEAPKRHWRWIGIAALVAVVVGTSLWGVGVFNSSSEEAPGEEAADPDTGADATTAEEDEDNPSGSPGNELSLMFFRLAFREAGVSGDSWDCVEQGLRDNGFLDDPAALEELVSGDTSFDAPLSELPPAARHFIEGLTFYMSDPVEGCLSPRDLEAMDFGSFPFGDDPMTVGSDPELDRLHAACQEGSMADCDMLYVAAPLGSEYEDVALACGGRNDPLGALSLGCQLEYQDFSGTDALRNLCEAGFFPGCDALFLGSNFGSSEETFGDTCGGRREPSELFSCFDEFGFGSR